MAFNTRLQQSNFLPTTSQVTVGVFKEIFEQLYQDGRDILTITISGKLSGTVESARQAAQLLSDANIEIVDSCSITIDQELVVLAAARRAIAGGSLKECK